MPSAPWNRSAWLGRCCGSRAGTPEAASGVPMAGGWCTSARRSCWTGGGSAVATAHRAELQRLLAAQVDPAAISLGACCTGFKYAANGVAVQFEDGREVRAGLLVGADGVHSVIRSQLFGNAPLRYRGYTAIRAITPAGTVPLPGEASETWGRGCRFGLAPTSGERVTWFATWNAPAGGDAGGTRQDLLSRFGDLHEPIRRVIEATPADSIVRTDIRD